MMKKHIKTCLALIAASSMMMAVNVSAQEDAKEDSAFPFTLDKQKMRRKSHLIMYRREF